MWGRNQNFNKLAFAAKFLWVQTFTYTITHGGAGGVVGGAANNANKPAYYHVMEYKHKKAQLKYAPYFSKA